MSKIKILPEILSNKIAAGEVVERPASVVKELVENALDAGSDRIVIEIEKGGRTLVQVSDNGTGMSRDDALLCIERYATSKIYRDEDLFAINTLGFRGEALPSIASVSRFSLITRDKDADIGTEIQIAGGKIKKVIDAGAPRGTLVAVGQLFFNTPARRKFLKTINTEMGHIVEAVSGIALGWPAVRFRLLHNGRVVKNWPAVSEPVERAVDVLGQDHGGDLHEIAHDDGSLSLSGWISSPARSRTTSRGIYIYVNGRIVKDRVVQHALFQGYAGRIVKGQFPVAVVFIRVPGNRVDVNVHPAKNEVRFADQKQIHDAVRQCVSRALAQSERSSWSSGYRPADNLTHDTSAISEKSLTRYPFKDNTSQGQWQITGSGSDVSSFAKPRTTGGDPTLSPFSPSNQVPPLPEQETLWAKKQFKDLIYVGQFHDTYLIFESGESLVIIDQHAAHERIVYEQLKGVNAATMEKQVLLIPESIDLNFREAAVMEKMIPELTALGFDVEPFGGSTFVIKSVPVALVSREIKPLIIEMLDTILESGDDAVMEKTLDDCIKIMACHSAIRANQELKSVEVEKMLEQLDACANPSNCPHGRPTWVNWPMSFLEKAFKRIV